MSAYLYRLGRFSFARRRLVVLIWLALLAASIVGAATLGGSTSEGFSIPGTPAQNAVELLKARFPESAVDGATARVVFAAPDGATLAEPSRQQAIQAAVAKLAEAPKVAAVADPFQTGAIAPDGRVAYAQVQYRVQFSELTALDREALVKATGAARDAGLEVEVGGDALKPEITQNVTEVIGVAVAAVVLVVTFGSLVAAGLPLLTALVGVGIGIAGVTAATGFVELSSTAPILALMVGLAVAIDYALFIVSRYRHELATGRRSEEAVGRAVGTAGSAVVFAGATVVIALAALSVVRIPFLTAMGLAAAVTVTLAVLIALTLLPALLGFAGPRVVGWRVRNQGASALSMHDPESGHTASGRIAMGERWGRFVTRHRIAVLLVALMGLGVLALPALDLQLGFPGDETASPASSQRKAYDLIAKGFGPGINGPLLVVVDATDSADIQAAAKTVAGGLAKIDGVVAVTPPRVNSSGDTVLLTVIPATGPSDEATKTLVSDIRGQADALAGGSGARVGVTGQTAIFIDVSTRLGDALLPYLVVVVGLAVLLLTIVFRSILVPIKATLGFLLTIGATFGAVVAVFQWGWLAELLAVDSTGPIISFLPIFLIGVVFGLAMDYEVFLVTRMREDFVHGAQPTEAVVGGFHHGARVVTAAALIMVSVFSGFILSDEPMIKAVGFALAAGVLIDAFIVRMTVVPAVMSLLGRSAWYLPRWLDRLLPNADVEGERLSLFLAAQNTPPPGATNNGASTLHGLAPHSED